MRFLTAIIDSLVGFVQRNPLLVLLIVILAFAAPSLLKGIAVFVLYLLLGLIVLVVAVILLFRWRIYRLQQQMGDQFAQGGFRQPGTQQPQSDQEGDVKIYRTAETPEKRVSTQVGDYVEFEETSDDSEAETKK